MKTDSHDRRCDGLLRRELLHVGALSAFGLSLADWLRGRRAIAADASGRRTPREPQATSCILIWLDGGPSHLDLFDLKPEAPKEIRGPYQPIATNVSGIEICEHLPRTAGLMGNVALVRSVTSPLGEHNFASHYLLTGYKPSRALVYPSVPSVQQHFSRTRSSIPTNLAINRPNGMLGSGYLPDSTLPFVIESDPSSADFRVKDLAPKRGMNSARLLRRQDFRHAVDQLAQQGAVTAPEFATRDTAFDQAFRLVRSPDARAAFDLDQEPATTRQHYGRHRLGQSCLLARRLVEAGAKFVTVTDRGWDTHEDLDLRLREGFTGGTAGKIPKLDHAYAALLADLAARGLLDSTLVLLMGEFGRTPKLNTRGGRDHWPGVFSVALAGGGVRGGQVVGQSDSQGELPADRPVTPANLIATVYRLLGIDGAAYLETSSGRPVQVNRDGRVIEELIA